MKNTRRSMALILVTSLLLTVIPTAFMEDDPITEIISDSVEEEVSELGDVELLDEDYSEDDGLIIDEELPVDVPLQDVEYEQDEDNSAEVSDQNADNTESLTAIQEDIGNDSRNQDGPVGREDPVDTSDQNDPQGMIDSENQNESEVASGVDDEQQSSGGESNDEQQSADSESDDQSEDSSEEEQSFQYYYAKTTKDNVTVYSDKETQQILGLAGEETIFLVINVSGELAQVAFYTGEDVNFGFVNTDNLSTMTIEEIEKFTVDFSENQCSYNNYSVSKVYLDEPIIEEVEIDLEEGEPLLSAMTVDTETTDTVTGKLYQAQSRGNYTYAGIIAACNKYGFYESYADGKKRYWSYRKNLDSPTTYQASTYYYDKTGKTGDTVKSYEFPAGFSECWAFANLIGYELSGLIPDKRTNLRLDQIYQP